MRGLRNVVDIAAQRDHGLSRSPARYPCSGNAGHAALDLEAFFLQDAGEIFRGLNLLKAELTEAEDAVHHDLHLLFHGVDLSGEIGLHGRFFVGRDFGLGEGGERAEHAESQYESEFSAYELV